MASTKHLVEVFGDRIRKNPQWKVKEMTETMKNELEVVVPRIKIFRVRKIALEGVVESLKVHYSRVRDSGSEFLPSNPKNTVKITRLNGMILSISKDFIFVIMHEGRLKSWV